MKNVRKVLLLVLCAVLLVCASVAGTVAYLTSQASVKNTFTVGDVKITLDEADYDDSTADADRDTQNAYHLLPGRHYTKDPTVHIKDNSEDCYVRILLTITNYDKLHTAFPDSAAWDDAGYFKLSALLDVQDGWIQKACKVSADGKSAEYEFWFTENKIKLSDLSIVTVAGYKDLPALFTKISVPGTMTNDQIAALNEAEINIVAHAIQANGFAHATAAWANWVE